MTRIVATLVMLAWTASVLAQGTFRVVPGGFANVEGNSASADLFRTVESRFQQVYSASEFANLGAPTGRIEEIAFRLDGSLGNSFVGFWPNSSVYLSATTALPDSLSPRYSDNASGDGVLVYGGFLFINATNQSSNPNSFEVRIPLATPFYYDPSRGNLSLTIITSPGPTNVWLDAENTAGDAIGRVFGDVAITGTPDTVGLTTSFRITPVPEPDMTILLGCGVAVVLAATFRVKKTR